MFTKRQKDSMDCKQCNSFAQWGIDYICKDFLEKYWDYEKNMVNPWEIASQYNKKVFIICQEKDYHGSYDISCAHFIKGVRCSYCVNMKVHKLDSLGYLFPESLIFWSDKNNNSPYDFSPGTQKEFLWKCPDKEHEDFLRSIRNSKRCDFRCPECNSSKGEKKIEEYFNKNGFLNIKQDKYKILDNIDKINNIYFIPQKEFDGLLGLGNGLLSYDFYLPNIKYNLLIEYQGEQHEKYIPGMHKSKEEFKKQQEHDRRKRKYAQNNNINLLEIWYWDFDNIEDILYRELRKIKDKDLEGVG
jgi:ribosomal protein S8